MTTVRLLPVTTEHECLRCFDVMHELRPHLAAPQAFVSQVMRQMAMEYRLLAAWQEDRVVGLVGYRLTENLLYGRFVYVDDLVVSEEGRRHGLGARLIAAVREEARQMRCRHLVLDTGLGMALAQRFYFRQGLLSRGMHFVEALNTEETGS
ncbi:GNAT family N-acetyltransferase [Chromohalobacter canadensis]|uniref:GNAT family N-acetyltransferase n=1 Tax=Chromohalobacter canadensis TaxID=141389 RepID=A0ABZ0YGM8_9GAMM|nr:GNAT family N-acetyltransferase [Chromohalobacter canadensis]MCK0770278.1 GNAT family N-acetyltransferase [Chromohalobacter canadensis]WQH10432.1 GNAT family N-acetyltransferase [Chromohalobacter canadensis]